MSKECKFMPLGLEALVLDDLTGGGSTMRRWEFSYRSMDDFQTPEPDAMNNDKEIKERGIWLRWVLPRELRTQSEQGDFPLIPNRWLITRVNQESGKITARVLESDCPTSSSMTEEEYDRIMPYTSQYLIGEEIRTAFRRSEDPHRREAYIQGASAPGNYHVNLGIPFYLEEWKEREKGCMFLTACAPGNPNFTGYIQHNSNILSFFDDLGETMSATFHYSVIGWFSGEKNRQIFCSGQVFSVPWNRAGFPITQDMDRYHDELLSVVQSGNLSVAVGETSDEAFRAYLLSRIGSWKGISSRDREKIGLLLATMREGCPDWLEEANGLSRLRDTLQGERFQEKYGGAKETREFDSQVRLLHSLQEELLDMWWKRGYLERHPNYKTGKKASEYKTYFEIDQKDSLLSRTITQLEKVKDLYSELKQKEACDSSQEGSQEGSQENSKDNGKKQLLGRFWRMENPYLLVSGLETAKDLVQENTVCRKEEDLLKAPNTIPKVSGLEKLPQEVLLLYEEAFLILYNVYGQQEKNRNLAGESEYAGEDAGHPYGGKLPDYPVKPWNQPWKPAFMEWRVSFEELSMDGRDQESFYFDGYNYQVIADKKTDPGHSKGYGGISTLDVHSKLFFAEQMKTLAETVKNEKLTELAQQVRNWKLVGQELVNLQDSMAQRDYRSFRRPYGEKITGTPYTMDEVLGFWSQDEEFYERVCGQMESVPLTNANIIPAYRFMRTGKMHLDDLIFYDGFGRVLNMVRSGEERGLYQSRNYPLIVPESMRTKNPSQDNGFLLHPGLLQYSRLSLSYVKQKEEPVLGFVILNRLNHSLCLFTPKGNAAGELIMMAGEHGKRRAVYLPFREMEENRLHSISKNWEALGKFIRAQEGKNELEFHTLLDVLDQAFWTMDAAGGNTDERVALLAGRPLALVQTQAYLDLYGLVRKDAGWKGGAEFTSEDMKFPMRIGSQPVLEDGVAGYFLDDTFKVFYSMAAPEREAETVCRGRCGKEGTYIPVGCGKENSACPYLLCDPLLSIHAYTGILPVKRLQLEKKMVLERLKKMEISFRMGPLPVRIGEGEAGELSAGMAKPALPGGTFMWLERGESAESTVLYTIHPSEDCQEGNPHMREGNLLFHPEAYHSESNEKQG